MNRKIEYQNNRSDKSKTQLKKCERKQRNLPAAQVNEFSSLASASDGLRKTQKNIHRYTLSIRFECVTNMVGVGVWCEI